MKRTVVAVLFFVLTTAALAEETQRYLVATRASLPLGSQSDAAVVLRDVEPRRVGVLRSFRGFAADLTPAEVAKLQRSSDVRWIEPVLPRHASEVTSDVYRQVVPWGIDRISAPGSWRGHRSAVVNAVVADTGIDPNHPDLRQAYAGGWSTFTDKVEEHDYNGHGTHVAGTIAAADNDRGVVGVNPQARVWGVQVLNVNGEGTTENVIKSLDWTIAKKQALGGQWVINFSLGHGTPSAAEREALQRAVDAGIIVVAAAGNGSTKDGIAPVDYPGAYPMVVAVGATTQDRKVATFSSQGPEVDLSAPGTGVLSTIPFGEKVITALSDESDRDVVLSITGSAFGTVTAPWVYCGVGELEEIPASLEGKIALFRRGTYKFAEKTRRAVARGAVGVVIFNDEQIWRRWTLFSEPADEQATWPIALQISREKGEALLQQGSGTLTLLNERYDYGTKNGTSMSTPHIVGAVSQLWSIAPDATPQQILDALYSTATDLGAPGADPVFGWGEVNVEAAARKLAPAAFVGRRRAAGTSESAQASHFEAPAPQASLSEIFASPDGEASDNPFGPPEVVVARIGADGRPELSCVGSEAAARRFFAPERGAKPSKQPQDH